MRQKLLRMEMSKNVYKIVGPKQNIRESRITHLLSLKPQTSRVSNNKLRDSRKTNFESLESQTSRVLNHKFRESRITNFESLESQTSRVSNHKLREYRIRSNIFLKYSWKLNSKFKQQKKMLFEAQFAIL